MATVFSTPAILEQPITFPVELDARGPLPNQPVYARLRNCLDDGFTFQPIDLLHAIGSKTAALPSSRRDECIQSAAVFIHILEFDGNSLAFRDIGDSDLQTPRSQELGIGMTCLIARDCFDVPWDQLEAIPGPGRRFDYRAVTEALRCLFESKGTKYRSKQSGQIQDGLEKKRAHNDQGDAYDIAVIVSTHVGVYAQQPRVLVADPEFPAVSEAFAPDSDVRFRYRHFARAMQFAGFTPTARSLYLRSRTISGLKPERQSYIARSDVQARLVIDGSQFVGQWIPTPSVISEISESLSKRSLTLFDDSTSQFAPGSVRIFQGISEETYETIISEGAEAVELLRERQLVLVSPEPDGAVSVFNDGTVLYIEPEVPR